MGRRLWSWLPGDVGVQQHEGPFLVVSVRPVGQTVVVLVARRRRLFDCTAGGTWLNAARRVSDAQDAVRAGSRRRLSAMAEEHREGRRSWRR